MSAATLHRHPTAGIGRGLGHWLAAGVVYVVAVRTVTGRGLDNRAFRDLRAALSDWAWLPDGSTLERLQPALLVIGLGVVCAGCLVNRCSPRSVAIALAVACGPAAAAIVLKAVLVRPVAVGDFAAHNSFPSGTVAAFAGIAAALTVLAGPGAQRVVARLAWCVTGVVGLIVIRAHWHRPSDVLGALLLATGAAALAGRRA